MFSQVELTLALRQLEEDDTKEAAAVDPNLTVNCNNNDEYINRQEVPSVNLRVVDDCVI